MTAATKLLLSDHLKLKTIQPAVLLAFVSSFIGAWMLSESSNAAWLELAIPLLLLLVVLFFGLLAITGAFLVDFYGSFWSRRGIIFYDVDDKRT